MEVFPFRYKVVKKILIKVKKRTNIAMQIKNFLFLHNNNQDTQDTQNIVNLQLEFIFCQIKFQYANVKQKSTKNHMIQTGLSNGTCDIILKCIQKTSIIYCCK